MNDIVRTVSEKATEYATNGVAVGAVTSWWWLDHIESFFGALLPVLGCFWLGIQIYFYFKHKRHKP